MYQEKIINLETGEVTFRDYSAEEIAEVEAAKAEAETKAAEAETKANARKAALEKLGLTDDEIKALFG